jgi:hypothetical protein
MKETKRFVGITLIVMGLWMMIKSLIGLHQNMLIDRIIKKLMWLAVGEETPRKSLVRPYPGIPSLNGRYAGNMVLTALKERIKLHGYTTVSDYKEEMSLPSNYQDTKIGWTNLSQACVRPVSLTRYAIFFPAVCEVGRKKGIDYNFKASKRAINPSYGKVKVWPLNHLGILNIQFEDWGKAGLAKRLIEEYLEQNDYLTEANLYHILGIPQYQTMTSNVLKGWYKDSIRSMSIGLSQDQKYHILQLPKPIVLHDPKKEPVYFFYPDEFSVPTHSEAVAVVNHFREVAKRYGYVSVMWLAEETNQEKSLVDWEYGWMLSDLVGHIAIKAINDDQPNLNQWYLDLPQPKKIAGNNVHL